MINWHNMESFNQLGNQLSGSNLCLKVEPVSFRDLRTINKGVK